MVAGRHHRNWVTASYRRQTRNTNSMHLREFATSSSEEL